MMKQVHRLSSQDGEGKPGLFLSCGGTLGVPLELEKQCKASCRVDTGIGSFLLRCHRAVTPAVVFCVDPRGDRRVNAGESGVSGVHWDIRVFWNGGRTPGVPLDFPVETTSS